MIDSKPPASGESYYEDYWKANLVWSPDLGNKHEDEQALFRTYLKPGQLLLDYGCGNGKRYGHEMARRGLDYRGFDVSETALSQAAELGLNVRALGVGGEVDLPDSSVDTAICFEVLEHLMEPERALQAIRQPLKPGGVLLLSVPNGGFYVHRIEFLLTGFRNPGGSPLTARKSPWNDPHIRFFNRSTLFRLVESCGFEVVEQPAEAFSLNALPWLYRLPQMQPLLKRLSYPLGWLGRVFPSLFSPRLFVVARKPSTR